MSTSTTDDRRPCHHRGAPGGAVLVLALLLTCPAVASDADVNDGTDAAAAGVAADRRQACDADQPAGVPMRVRRVRGVPFDWITGDLEVAITERNFRITGRNLIGQGLRERGYEGYPDHEVIHFCNLENARTVLDLDPGFVAQMPCRVAVHVEGDEVVVSMPLLPETHPDARVVAFSRRINAELCAIQDYAVERP